MSKKRRRNRRHNRGLGRTAGAGHTRHPLIRTGLPHEVVAEQTEARDRVRQGERDHRDGKGERKQPRDKAKWRDSDVDQESYVHGTSNALRRTTAAWGGLYLQMIGWTDRQFLGGKGLRRDGRFVLYVQQKERGRTDDGNVALAFSRAAQHLGLEAEMHDSAER